MNKRGRILLLVLVPLTVAAIIIWWCYRPTGPAYQGKRLTQWLEVLNQAYRDDSGSNKSDAREAIHAIGTNALPHLVTLLQPGSPADKRFVACAAFEILGPTAAPAIPQISPLLANLETATEAAATLEHIGPAALPTLTAALTDRNTPGRAKFPGIIARIPGDKSARVPLLLDCLRDTDVELRCAAVRALGSLQTNAASIVPALVPLLADGEPRIRQNSADALAQLATQPETVVPALLPLLGDHDWRVRKSAMLALGLFGKEAGAAVPLLTAKLNQPYDFSELYFASLALKRIAPGTALELSARNLQNPNSANRQAAALTLGGFGLQATNYVPLLQQLKARDQDTKVRLAADDALVMIEKSQRDREN